MYAAQSKNILVLNILKVLQKYSDENHRLSQKTILEYVEKDFEMPVDRKAIKRNLMNLIDADFDLEYTETIRTNKKGEQEALCSDWYLVREFTDAELRLLIDGLLFSKHIPYNQCQELVEKLKGLSSKYFEAKVKYIKTLPENMPANKQIFSTIDMLDEAISTGKQVEFLYNDFGIDKKLHPRLDSKGEPRRYVINPYQMAATNGRYYLLANYDKYDNISHYRIDRISGIKILDTPVKKQRSLSESINLPKHMAEHIYMFSGANERVTMRIKKCVVSDVIDWFGRDVSFYDETEDEVTASVIVNLQAMRYWAMQYARFVEVLRPASLREEIKQDLLAAMGRYGEA